MIDSQSPKPRFSLQVPKRKKQMTKVQKPGAATANSGGFDTNRAAKNTVAYEDTVPEVVSCESEDVIVVEERPIKDIIQ